MAAKTIHVYPLLGAWTVKREGKRADIFATKREALELAVREGRNTRPSQIAVYGKDGRMEEHRTYGMPKVQDPPNMGRRASQRIRKAVAKVVLDRLRSDALPPRVHMPRAHAPAK